MPPPEKRAGRRILVDALAARFGGTAYAAIRLATGLAERSAVDQVVVVTRADSIVSKGLTPEDRLRVVEVPRPPVGELVQRTFWEATSLRTLVRTEDIDTVVTYSGILLRRPGAAVICHLLNPAALGDEGLGNVLRRLGIRETTRWATHVAAPTPAMADVATTTIDRPTRVIPLGVALDRFIPAESPGRDVLCVADFYEHKRHEIVLGAWARLPEPRPSLRLIGNAAPNREHAAHVERLASIHGDRVTIEHDLSLEELSNAYREARAFVIASTRESFCMPLLESLASGVPAVVTDVPILRDTGDGGARYVDSDDPAEWSAALGEIVSDDRLHSELRESGIRHAAKFPWTRMVDEMLALDPAATPPLPGRPSTVRAWLVPAALSLVFALAVVAAFLARQQPTSSEATDPQQNASSGGSATLYGENVDSVVPAPNSSLAALAGNRWRRLSPGFGRIRAVVQGDEAPYYSVGLLAVSTEGRARLQIVTERDEKGIARVAGIDRAGVINFGPFRLPQRGDPTIGLALRSLQDSDPSQGPPLNLSPVSVQYLRAGDAVLPPERLREAAAGGSRGFRIASGQTARLLVTPGVAGPTSILMGAASTGPTTTARVSVGGTTRSVRLRPTPQTVRVSGPFPAGTKFVTIAVPRASPEILLTSARLRPASGR